MKKLPLSIFGVYCIFYFICGSGFFLQGAARKKTGKSVSSGIREKIKDDKLKRNIKDKFLSLN